MNIFRIVIPPFNLSMSPAVRLPWGSDHCPSQGAPRRHSGQLHSIISLWRLPRLPAGSSDPEEETDRLHWVRALVGLR